MATTRKAGRNGRVYLSTTNGGVAVPVGSLNAWSIDFSVDKIDVTCFGDSNKVSVAGLPDASGSFGGVFDTAGQAILSGARDGQSRNWYLYPFTTDPTVYFYGEILVDASFETSVSKEISLTSKWSAAGPITPVGIT